MDVNFTVEIAQLEELRGKLSAMIARNFNTASFSLDDARVVIAATNAELSASSLASELVELERRMRSV